MKWKIEFSNKFLKNQKRFPGEIKKRVTGAVKQIVTDPYSGVPLTGPLKGVWKKAVGKYRIEYLIDNDNQKIIFVNVDLRKKIYKR